MNHLHAELNELRRKKQLQNEINFLKRANNIELDETEPDWAADDWGTFLFGSLTKYQITGCDNYDQIQFATTMDFSAIRVADFPFACGSLRTAHHAQFAWETSEARRIAKVQLDLSDERCRCEDDVEIHLLASWYANEFNQYVGSRLLDYSSVMMFECMETPFSCDEQFSSEVLLVEQAIEEFKKFNNNLGFTESGHARSDLAQAFSHFTFHHSQGILMVVDIQGGRLVGTDQFLLTDPTIHHRDTKRFGATNHGAEGFYKFFDSHECNDMCRGLRII